MSSSRIAPLEFGRDINRLTEGFTGREWVLQEIDAWLRDPRPRLLLLTGEPGVGKSAVAARLIQTRDDIVAHHFCVSGRTSTVTPNTVLRSLAAQLSESLPAYGLALANTIKPSHLSVHVHIDVRTMTGGQITGVVINHLHASDPEEEFEVLLRAPLSHMPATDEPSVILVDSLDEAVTYQGQTNLVTLLAEMDDFPEWVRVICTTRPERRVLRYFDTFDPYVLAADSPMNVDDIHDYVTARIKRKPMISALTAVGRDATEVGDYLTQLSDGNFLFVKVMLDDLEDGRQSLHDLTALPRGLDGIYHGFLKRFSVTSWEERYQRVLGVLAVTQEPITEEQLAHFTSLPRSQLRQSLGVVLQFLDVDDEGEGPKTYTLYHRTLREYLLDEERNEDFWCASADANLAITHHYFAKHLDGWSTCDNYGLRHLPVHLFGARETLRLRDHLLKFDWLQAKLNATDVGSLIVDFDLLPEDHLLRTVRDAIRLSKHILARERKQLGTQLLGRLLFHHDPHIRTLLNEVKRLNTEPWLCPLASSLERPGGPLLHTIAGQSTIKSLVTMADGHQVIVASSDGVIAVWNLDSGEKHFTVTIDPGISHIAITKDCRRAIAAAVDYTAEGIGSSILRIWDLVPNDEAILLKSHAIRVTDLAVTLDGRLAISASHNGSLEVWDLCSGDQLHTLKVFSGVSNIAAMPDGRRCIFSSYDGTLNVWDFATAEHARSIEAPSDVTSIVAMPDGRSAIFASYDGTLRVWDLEANCIKQSMSGHSAVVTGMAVSSGSRCVASSSSDGTVKLWDLEKGCELGTFFGHSGWVEAVAMTPDGSLAVSASEDGSLKIWDLEDGAESEIMSSHTQMVTNTLMTVDGRRAISASEDATLKVWDLTSGEVSRTLAGHTGPITAVAMTMDGHGVVSASEDATLSVWDLDSGEVCWTVAGHTGPFTAVAVTMDGRSVVSASRDDTLKVWDRGTGKEQRALEEWSRPAGGEYGRGSLIAPVLITPDDRFVIWVRYEELSGFGKAFRSLHVWDLTLDTCETLHSSFGRWTKDNWHAVALVPGTVPAVTAASGLDSVSIWNLESGNEIARLDGLLAPTAIAVLPDVHRAIFGLHDGTLEMWDLAEATRLDKLAAHHGVVSGISVMTTSRLVVSISHDSSLKVWNLESGTVVADFYDDASLLTCCIAPAEDILVVGNSLGRVHVLDVKGTRDDGDVHHP